MQLFYMDVPGAKEGGVNLIFNVEEMQQLEREMNNAIMEHFIERDTKDHAKHTQPQRFCTFCQDAVTDTL